VVHLWCCLCFSVSYKMKHVMDFSNLEHFTLRGSKVNKKRRKFPALSNCKVKVCFNKTRDILATNFNQSKALLVLTLFNCETGPVTHSAD